MAINNELIEQLALLQEKINAAFTTEFPGIENGASKIIDPEFPASLPKEPEEKPFDECKNVQAPPTEIPCTKLESFNTSNNKEFWNRAVKETREKQGSQNGKYNIRIVGNDAEGLKAFAKDFVDYNEPKKSGLKPFGITKRYLHWWLNNGTDPAGLAIVLWFLLGGGPLVIVDLILCIFLVPAMLFSAPGAKKKKQQKIEQEYEDLKKRVINNYAWMHTCYDYMQKHNAEVQKQWDEYHASRESKVYKDYVATLEKNAAERSRLTKEYNEKIAAEQSKLDKKAKDYAKEIGYPASYLGSVAPIKRLLEDGRADTLKEAINLHESIKAQEELRAMQEAAIQAQEEANKPRWYNVLYRIQYGPDRGKMTSERVMAKSADDAMAQVEGSVSATPVNW